MGNKSSSNRDSENQSGSNRNEVVQSQSYYTMIKNSYQSLVNAIIRPPRCEYEISQLGPVQFEFCGKSFIRNDFHLTNPRNLKICCSRWEPLTVSDRASIVLPCVIYMHGNSSSRLEALSSLSLVLSLGASLIAFDFAGSGMSEGEYVSLGAFEKDDLQCVIEFLRSEGKTSTIALWGRSMGAATALLHGERDPSIAAMILDSTFSSLVLLAEEMVEMGRQQGLFAPGILVRLVMQFVRSSVLKAANFDIRKLAPIDSADKCYIPAMFIAAEHDRFVKKTHSVLIHEKYSGDKNIVIVEGDHNSKRPMFLYDSIGIFLSNTLQIPESWHLSGSDDYIRRQPWLWGTVSQTAATSSSNTLFQYGGSSNNNNNNNNSSNNNNNSSITSNNTSTTSSSTRNHHIHHMQSGGTIASNALALDGIDITMDELLALQFEAYDDEDGSLAVYDTSAEEKMQANVQDSLFQLFNNTTTTSNKAKKEDKTVHSVDTSSSRSLPTQKHSDITVVTPTSTTSSSSTTTTATSTTTSTIGGSVSAIVPGIEIIHTTSTTQSTPKKWQCMICAADNITTTTTTAAVSSMTTTNICIVCGTKQ